MKKRTPCRCKLNNSSSNTSSLTRRFIRHNSDNKTVPMPTQQKNTRPVRVTITRIEQCYNEHRDRLCNAACNLVKDRTAAQDIVQEAFLAVLKYEDSRMTDDELERCLHKICRNKAFNFLKHGKKFRSRREIISVDPDDLLEYPDMNDQLAAGEIIKESVDKVLKGAENLPSQKRTVIELSLEGFTTKEVAKILGIPVAHVHTIRSKAVTLLRKIIGLPGKKKAIDG